MINNFLSLVFQKYSPEDISGSDDPEGMCEVLLHIFSMDYLRFDILC